MIEIISIILSILSIIITIIFIIFWDKYREKLRKRDYVRGHTCPYCRKNITYELKHYRRDKLECQKCKADLTSFEKKIKRDPPIELYDEVPPEE